jgi:hypothetical protein
MIINKPILLIFIIISIVLTSITSSSANSIRGWFGDKTSGGGIAIADINQNGIPDLVVLNIDHPEGGNIGYYRIGFDLKQNKDATRWSPIMKINGWFGDSTAAADIAIVDLNNNGIPDLIIFHIDNPDGGNSGYYRVGWDLKPNGEVSSWDAHLSDPIKVPGWFGDETQGGGIAIADINQNGIPDLIIFHIDNPDYGNKGYYRICWDLDSKGEGIWDASFDPPIRVLGWFGDENQGGDIAVADLNQNGKPDFIVFHIDHSKRNKGYYRIGWDVDTNGDVTKWDQPEALEGDVGFISSAAGIDILSKAYNGADILYFTVRSYDYGESPNGVYYDKWICWGSCIQPQGDASAEAGSGFIEEPTAKPEQATFGSLEENTDRMGMNIGSFDLSSPDPLICQQACADNPDCKSFTYVKPGYQGTNARCYLKSSVPDATSNDCCISGVKGGGTTVVVQPGFILPAQP